MKFKFNKKIIKFLPSIIWMLIIFYFSSRQTTGVGGDSYWLRFAVLKSFHLVEYAVLAILFAFVIKKNKNIFLISYFYALTDEFHQSFIMGRNGQFKDTLFDLTGILIGILIINFLKKRHILK